jgi:FixJ family two-component response regulator
MNVPGCLVLDVRLPGLSGLDLQKRIADAGIEIPIIFITGHGDIPMTVRAMKAGAVELVSAFRKAGSVSAATIARIQSNIERRQISTNVARC